MELVTAKSELSPGRRGLCATEGDSTTETKCIKRRRRSDPSNGNNNQGEQQQQQKQQVKGDQPTATTVKRSSRFRGVSRFLIYMRFFSWLFCYNLCIKKDERLIISCCNRHRWTGRFEAHLWDKGSWNPTQRKKGKQGMQLYYIN